LKRPERKFRPLFMRVLRMSTISHPEVRKTGQGRAVGGSVTQQFTQQDPSQGRGSGGDALTGFRGPRAAGRIKPTAMESGHRRSGMPMATVRTSFYFSRRPTLPFVVLAWARTASHSSSIRFCQSCRAPTPVSSAPADGRSRPRGERRRPGLAFGARAQAGGFWNALRSCVGSVSQSPPRRP